MLEPQRNIINILCKIVIKFIYKDSKPKGKKDRHIEMQFFDLFEKKQEQKIPNNLTSDFSFARSLFLSRSTIWTPEIAYISSYRHSLITVGY